MKWAPHTWTVREIHSYCREGANWVLDADWHPVRPLIIVDNTNLSHDERWFYTREATMHGYRVHVVTVEEDSPRDNIHGVPAHAIDRMREKMLMDTAKNLI